MDFQDLHAFIAVAETQSFSAAAERLHLTQPAVSKRVANLEERLSHRLFDRIGRGVGLTDAGRTLLPYAQATLSQLDDARHALSHLDGEVSGRLRIGTSHHIGLHRLPPVLRRFSEDYPKVELDIHFMDSELACEAVLTGKLELGIVTLPTGTLPQLATRRIWPDPLSVVVGAQHPWARHRRLPIEMLAQLPALLPDEGTYTHRIVRAALAERGIEPQVRLATNYLETLKMLVGIGLGWSVLPHSMVDSQLRAIPVPGLRMHRELGLAWHQRRTLSASCRALMHICSDAAAA